MRSALARALSVEMVQSLIYGLVSGSAYALVALGFALIFSTVRFFNLAHGAVYTVGAYSCYAALRLAKLPFALSVAVGVCAAALLGLVFDFAVFAPLRRRHADGLVLLIASLGLLVVAQGSVALIFGNDTRTISSGIVVEGLPFLGARVTPVQITIFGVGVALFVLTGAFLRRTRWGTVIRAVAEDPELARTKAIDSDLAIRWTFLLGSALAGVAAILISLDTDMNPTMGFQAVLFAVVAMIIGGVGSMLGAYVGGLLLGIVQNLSVFLGKSEWQDTWVFLVFLLFLLIRPSGILGRTKPGS